ncbi:hypothetical protein APD36_06215 [Acinetobacter pittii]|nr:hypothetical protein APD36_06215 [Acinetobacter pittii]KQF53718.1 hypothetical protein APC05_30310 [Acinetobacter pittii]KQG00807.1 hypothetical protein APC29_18260 [Acinetobacter pittii]OCY53131.1 hypothetical protein BFR82_19405 [Acinetobacter pittii]RSO72017.1 hypothetical protein EA754_17155 [Acinetobacter pittii]
MLTMGKDYDYVRNEMDLPRLRALGAYQQSNPPAHIGIQRLCRILEAFMGIEETPQAITVSDDEEEDMLEVLESFPQGG